LFVWKGARISGRLTWDFDGFDFLFLFFEVGVPVTSVELSDSVREVEAKELEESATLL
jgi:hypothetical protein